VPAPLGKTPTKKMPDIQVFGTEESAATRNAIRFFRERRIVVSFVDLRKRPMAPAELRRFIERLGARALLDETSRPFRDGGLGHLTMDEREIADRLQADQRLVRQPLIRFGNEVTAGKADETWTAWLRDGRTSATARR
jgi:arsenate reductase-like glutaredoxin family protein